jgi:hypothetical protein
LKESDTMDEAATESILRQMDEQLFDLLGSDKMKVMHEPEREVHIDEARAAPDLDDDSLSNLELEFSMSSEVCCRRAPRVIDFLPRTSEKGNPEDTRPPMVPAVIETDEIESITVSQSHRRIRSDSEDETATKSCDRTASLSGEDESSMLGSNDSEIQSAVDAIREEASRVEAALAIDQLQTMQNELISLTKLMGAQSEQIDQLKRQVKKKDDSLAMMKLERDLFKADMHALELKRREAARLQSSEIPKQTAGAGSGKDLLEDESGSMGSNSSNTEEASNISKRRQRKPVNSLDIRETRLPIQEHSDIRSHDLQRRLEVQYNAEARISRSMGGQGARSEGNSKENQSNSEPLSPSLKFEVIQPDLELPTKIHAASQVRSVEKHFRSTPLQELTKKECQGKTHMGAKAHHNLPSTSASASSQIVGLAGPLLDSPRETDVQRPKVLRSQSTSGKSPTMLSSKAAPLRGQSNFKKTRPAVVRSKSSAGSRSIHSWKACSRASCSMGAKEEKPSMARPHESFSAEETNSLLSVAASQKDLRTGSKERRHPQRLCGVPLFRRKKHLRKEDAMKQASSRRREDSSSLQAQVEELAQRLRASMEGSEGLRRRLAMISHYYESTVRRLQENIVSLKKEKEQIERDLVKQVESVDREKRCAIKKAQMLLRQKDEEIANLKKEKLATLRSIHFSA